MDVPAPAQLKNLMAGVGNAGATGKAVGGAAAGADPVPGAAASLVREGAVGEREIENMFKRNGNRCCVETFFGLLCPLD